MNDSSRFWTIAGLAVLGILVGIGPFQRGHALLDSCSSDEDIEYAVDNNTEESTGGDISFRGKDIQHSCNIDSHDCAFGVDKNRDGYCDNCKANDFDCNMSEHTN